MTKLQGKDLAKIQEEIRKKIYAEIERTIQDIRASKLKDGVYWGFGTVEIIIERGEIREVNGKTKKRFEDLTSCRQL